MKKFDIELARQGKRVCTRDGRPVRILCFDRRSTYPIVAIISNVDGDPVYAYTESGSYIKEEESNNLDLMMVGEKRKMWVNVYGEYSGSPVRSFGGLKPYATEEEAKSNINDQKNYIATVPVEWEE